MSAVAPDIVANEYLLIGIFTWLEEGPYEKMRRSTAKADNGARRQDAHEFSDT